MAQGEGAGPTVGPGTEEQQEVKAARHRALRVTSFRSLVLVGALLRAWLGAEGIRDGMTFREVRDNLGEPDRTVEQLLADETRLERYRAAPDYRHLL